MMTKMRKTFKTRLFLVVSMLLLTACSSFIDQHTFRMGKTSDIKIEDLKSFDRNGLLIAQATIKNKGNAKPVQYRFQWLGPQGEQVWADEAWKPLVIPDGRTAVIEGVAPTIEATEFKIQLDSY
jgi:uncharacterized protein YcfL